MAVAADVNTILKIPGTTKEIDVRSIAGLSFASLNLSEASLIIRYYANEGTSSLNVYTVNVDILVQAFTDPAFMQVLLKGHLLFADGMPVVWLSKLLGRSLPGRVAGSDLIEVLCREANPNTRLFMLGARAGVGELASENIKSKYGVITAGVYAPSREEILDDELSSHIVSKINASGANILLVAFGAPLQEKWISQHSHELDTRINIGVGATVDFLAGTIERSPVWMRKSGLEWLYRLAKEPRRLWRRYLLRDAKFFWIAVRLLISRLKDQS